MFLIGIDDTDNAYTRGTGHRARLLARMLAAAGLGRVRGITRHQLLVDEAIPYTSHNSSACLALADTASRADVIRHCREFLLRESAVGADAGLCVSAADRAATLCAFGARAKAEVLDRAAAIDAAQAAAAHLEGLTGTRGGVIGAAAAVGLHAAGEDGRYLWLPAIRELAGSTVTLRQLLERTGLDAIRTLDGEQVEGRNERIELGDWPRAIRSGGRAILLVEKQNANHGSWRVVPREIIKRVHP
jgi:hypothetical protein